MKCARLGLRCAAVAVSGLALAATTLAGTAAAGAGTAARAAAGPVVKLVAAQNEITVGSFNGQVFLDPGIYVASLKSALEFHVQRPSYTKPVTISQIIHLPGGSTRTRPLPASVLSGFDGLRDFIRMRVKDSHGKTVVTQRGLFCPASFDPQRVSPDSPANSPYPQQCGSGDPFPVGLVWGLAKGWAADPFENFFNNSINLALGTYQVTVNITSRYKGMFHISARDATATVTVKVVKQTGCCLAHSRRPVAHGGPLPSAPAVPYLRHPPQSALPDLVALPSWGITTGHFRTKKNGPETDLLNFGATVWTGGTSPLDVEGFRSHGSPVMKAYQYFSRNGRIIGRVRAGTMGFDKLHGHDHWHFEQFARYRLLNSSRTVAVLSHKQGFCIAPTDSVNMLLPNASWQQSFTGFGGNCGAPTALWVREMLSVGWGDTYFQSVAGQSFNITHQPNGTYYIEIIANPQKVLRETTTSNDISLRKVILSGTPGHRTVRVPAWHGIDPEG
jgi:Lysyl oxidase